MIPCKTCIVLAVCKTRHVKPHKNSNIKNARYVDTIDLDKCQLFYKWWIKDENWSCTTSRYELSDVFNSTHIME